MVEQSIASVQVVGKRARMGGKPVLLGRKIDTGWKYVNLWQLSIIVSIPCRSWCAVAT